MFPRRFPALPALAGAAIVVLSIARTSILFASEPGPEDIAWRSDYAQALEEARGRDQLLWIQFTGPWCPNCTRMEDDTFPHPAIREQARRAFVAVKLRSDLNEELALGFDLSGLPATVIVAPTREVVAVHQGYLGPDELARLLGDSQARHGDGRRLAAAASARRRESETGKIEDPLPARKKAKTEDQLALSGYCPVSLISDKKLVAGQTEYTVTHEGRHYRFASRLTFNLFRRDPERYVPVNDGNCPVAQVERGARQPGDPRYGALYQGRLFLCSNAADRKRFLEDPAHYAVVDVAERGFCPHCLDEEGLLVPGDPRYDLTRGGRRYWFPDPSHREAFLAAATSSTSRR
jgi:YHS domain-containing protein/thioredoxin-related protein